MNLSVNSPSSTRLKALASLVNEGETITYAAAMYDVPLATAQEYIKGLSDVPFLVSQEYLAGLSERTPANMVENDKSILPYIIMLKGTFAEGFEYVLTGGGIHGKGWTYRNYDHAYREALGWIEFDSLGAMIDNI